MSYIFVHCLGIEDLCTEGRQRYRFADNGIYELLKNITNPLIPATGKIVNCGGQQVVAAWISLLHFIPRLLPERANAARDYKPERENAF